MTTRVLLADDHVLFAQALTQRLAQRFDVIDIAGDGRALLASARKHKPDVIVADITMPFMSGLESIRALRKDSYVPKIVFLTMHADINLARECFNCGGSAFISKECAYDELIVAIDAVMANNQYVSPNIAGLVDLMKEPGGVSPESLTARQIEILQLFAEGKTMKEIASITNLSTRTVEWHKYRMMRMLRVRRSAELVQQAMQMKLVI
jgi:NarL family two-component system response regulator LiaR